MTQILRLRAKQHQKPAYWWRVKLTNEVKMRSSFILPATVSKINSKLNRGKKVNDKPLKRGVFFPLLSAIKLGPENAINKQLHLFTS